MAVHRNANILLLFLILLNLVVISGTFIFFQKSYEGIYGRAQAKTESLDATQSELAAKYKSLQEAQKEIRAKQQNEEVTAKRYQDVSSTKETLEKDILDLEAQKKQFSKELAAQQSATADIKAKAAISDARGGQLRSEVGQYNEDLRRLGILMATVQEEIIATKKAIQIA